jgi:diguanylate cyclase (GGDEF)-like protein
VNTTKYSVLAIIDREASLAALTDILHPGYTIITEECGAEGVRAAEEYLPDVILLDKVTPDSDGCETLAALKKSEKTKALPVILIIENGCEDEAEKGLALGASDFIVKPFHPAVVTHRIRSQIKAGEQLREIERLSVFDQLTELLNRRSFENKLKTEWGRSLRENTSVSLLLMDIDRFKEYNDAYGHQQGDAALREVAKILSKINKRPADISARWSGGGFIVLLPNTDLYGAIKVAEQIRGEIEDMEIPGPGGTAAKLTVSIGINARELGRNSTPDEFISDAETLLYEAKDKGRNRVCHK